MNINLHTSQFMTHSVSWLDTKVNTIMDGNFTKLCYIMPNMTMNGLYLVFPVELTKLEMIDDKIQIKFCSHTSTNSEMIKHFTKIEGKMLDNYILTKQKPLKKVLLLSKQLFSGFMKVYKENHYSTCNQPNIFCVKISGVWETKDECGLTYKLFGGETVPEL